jgi:putative NADPH-quinone reductase
VLVVTTLGAPWWVDWLVMRRPVKRVLKNAILGTCAPNCQFEMLSLYKSELLDEAQVKRFSKRVEKTLAKWI